MRDRQSRIKSMSPSLLAASLFVLLLAGCGEDEKPSSRTENPPLALPPGVRHEPDSALSPSLVLEPRQSRPHLLHVELQLPEGKRLLRLRVLGAAPGFEELASKDMSRWDKRRIQESFELPAADAGSRRRHVLVIADYADASYGAAQALPNF